MDEAFIDRINAITEIQSAGQLISETDYMQKSVDSVFEAATYQLGGQMLQEARVQDFEYMRKYLNPVFITGIVLYSLEALMIIVSVWIISCVLKTQERRYKNIAHISWASSLSVIFINSIYTGIFIHLSVSSSRDACNLLDYTEREEDFSQVTTIFNPQISPILNTCVFGE